MRPSLRPWIHATAAVVLASTLFLLLGLWAARLPREPLAARIASAFASGELIENDWPWLDGRRGFNQYHDCSVLQMISNRDDAVWANAVAPLIYNRSRGETDRCATLRTLVTEGPHTASYLVYRYTRYWHGYNPVAAALLQGLELRDVRRVLQFALYGALILLVAAAGSRDQGLLAVAAAIAATGTLFWAVRYFGQSLTHGPGDIAVILGIGALLRWRGALARPAALVPFCAVYGAVVVYLEFLTGLLPTAAGLLVPVAYLVARGRPAPENEPAAAWRFAGAALLAFALGAALAVVIKQVLAVAIVGPEAARSFVEYLQRYVNPSPGASLRHFGETWAPTDESLVWSSLRAVYAVLTQGYVLAYGSHAGAMVLYAASALAWLAAARLAFGRRRPFAVSDLLGCAAGVAIILGWALAFQTHTTIHKWWMVRMLLVPLSFGWAALAWQLLAVPRAAGPAPRTEPAPAHGAS